MFIPVMMIAGMSMGAAWGFIPGYLKAKFNVNEIISYADDELHRHRVDQLLDLCRLDRGWFPDVPQVPGNGLAAAAVSSMPRAFPLFRGLTTHLGLLLGIVAAVIVVVHHLSQPLGL